MHCEKLSAEGIRILRVILTETTNRVVSTYLLTGDTRVLAKSRNPHCAYWGVRNIKNGDATCIMKEGLSVFE
jgi:hypothetical protein